MYENTKLAEAKYFYSQMSANSDDREKFTHNLSAFISSARSVLQYALDEAKTKNGGQAWYDKKVVGSPILGFFKDKRDINIHTQPVRPIRNTSVTINAKLGISTSVVAILRDANGNIKQQSTSETSNHKPLPQPPPSNATVRYTFSDWAGSEDVMNVCQQYIVSLEGFVKDGIDRGFLTG